MKTYIGIRQPDGTASVYIEEDGQRRPLPHLVKHSPTGYEWGYGGSGPADLARSLLANAVGVQLADALYQKFKWEAISQLPYRPEDRVREIYPNERLHECWRIPEDQLLIWVDEQNSELRKIAGGA